MELTPAQKAMLFKFYLTGKFSDKKRGGSGWLKVLHALKDKGYLQVVPVDESGVSARYQLTEKAMEYCSNVDNQ